MTDPGFDDLDEESPLGDDTAETAGVVICPYCGEAIELALDASGGADQEYVEDCEVCCRPWRVNVSYDDNGVADVTATPLED